MVYQFKYDSTQGKYQDSVTCNDDKQLIINNHKIQTYAERDPSVIPWKAQEVVFVAECTGIIKNVEQARVHLGDTVVKVLVSAPNDGPMFVMGVNEKDYNNETVISNASCTTNCLAPMAKVLDDEFGIESGLMTTIHGATATQNTVDGPNKKWRSGRGAMQNIIPASTGAAKAVGVVCPALNGKLTGMAFRVPVPDGSCVDLCVNTKKDTSLEEILSQDIIGNSCSSIVDAKACIGMGKRFFKII